MSFKVKDSNIFLLPNNPHMVHLGTISSGFREFICMLDKRTQKFYIEEVVLTSIDFSKDIFANCKFIEDDDLAFDLAKFAEEKGLLDIKKRFEEAGSRLIHG